MLMNVAFFTDTYYPRINGVSVSVHSYATRLAELGNSVCIVCCNYDDSRDELFHKKNHYEKLNPVLHPNLKIFRISALTFLFSKEDKSARLSAWHEVKHAMDDFKPDIIHINTEFMVGYFGLIYSRHRHVASVYTFHTLWKDYIKNYVKFIPSYSVKKIVKDWTRIYLKKTDFVIAPTEKIAAVIKEYDADKTVHILPTGIPDAIDIKKINTKKFYFKHLYSFLPKVQKKHVLLYVGRLVKEKNLDFLFPVFLEVKKVFKDTAMVFVGDGPDADHLKNLAKKTGFGWDIIFAGYRNKEEIAYFYSISDVFVFPSKTETQGLVTLESMMAGLPVVAIGEMGTVDIMQGDNGGFMVREDVNEFSQKVIDLMKDKKLYKEKCEEAKKWASKWSINLLTEKLLSYYKEAIEIRKSR